MQSPSGMLNEASGDLDRRRVVPTTRANPGRQSFFRTTRSKEQRPSRCARFTTQLVDAPLIRLPVAPTTQNGLNAASHVMVDKITTVAKSKLQKRVGKLARRGHDSV